MRHSISRVLAGLLVLGLAGCFSGPEDECQSDSDCPAGRVCDPSLKACLVDSVVDAGSWGIEWVSPLNNARVGKTVTLVAKVTTPTGETPPSSVDFHGVHAGTDAGVMGTLSRTDAGSYASAWTPDSEGTYSFQAVVEPTNPDQTGALSDPLNVTVDLTAPVLGLVIPEAPTRPADSATTSWTDPSSSGAYRRDETTPVTVWSDAPDVDPASVHVSVVGFATPAPAPIEIAGLQACSAGNAHHGAKFCRVGELDLAKPELVGMRGSFTVAAAGADDLGNTSSVDGSVEVTRWKWSFDAGTEAIAVTPAVGHEGNLYLATSAATQGSLISVNPDGTQNWSAATGSMLTAPSVGETTDGDDRIYVAQASGADYGLAAYAADGSLLTPNCMGIGASTSAASLSVAPRSSGAETAFSAVEAGDGTAKNLLALDVDSTDCLRSSAASLTPPFPDGALSGDGSNLYYGTGSGGTVVKYSLTGGAWTDNGGWAHDVQLTVPSVAVTGAGIAGGGGPGEGGLFALDPASSALDWTYPSVSPASGFGTVGDVVAGAEGQLFAGLTNASTSPTNRLVAAKVGTTSFAFQSATVAGAPILGENRRLYTVSPTGSLSVFEAADLTPLWTASVASGSVAASPNMDCTRNPDGSKAAGRPGVLYIPTTSGKLFAVIVDSRGIDTSADWPKYLHDPRNTSNAQTSLAEFACP